MGDSKSSAGTPTNSACGETALNEMRHPPERDPASELIATASGGTIADGDLPSPFRLGAATICPDRNLVFGPGGGTTLEPRVIDTLCHFARHPGETLSRDSVIQDVWGVSYGAEDSLTRAVSLIRKALRTAGVAQPVIQTIPKRGYRLLVAPVPVPGNHAQGSRIQGDEQTPSAAHNSAAPRQGRAMMLIVLMFVIAFAVSHNRDRIVAGVESFVGANATQQVPGGGPSSFPARARPR